MRIRMGKWESLKKQQFLQKTLAGGGHFFGMMERYDDDPKRQTIDFH